jgi:hypothetical protein
MADIGTSEEMGVTPAMIDAGMEVVWNTPIMEPDEMELRAMVAEIFRRMFRASSKRPLERR